MKDSMIFYRSFMESFAELPDDERLKIYDAVLKYGLDGEDPELSGTLAALFKLVKPQLDANERRYQNSLKGGRKPNANQTETKPKPNETKSKPNETKLKPNVNDNDNDNDNINVNEKGNDNASGSDDDIPSHLLSYLNQKTGAQYKNDAQTVQLIVALFGQGYSEEDMKTVIDRKCAEWGDDEKMRSYLRPSTLFGEKFGEYLNAPESVQAEKERTDAERNQAMRGDLEGWQRELKRVTDRITEIRSGGDDSLKANYDELNDLKLRQAVVEDSIAVIERRIGVNAT